MPPRQATPIPAALAVEIEPFGDDELDEAIDAIWAGQEVPAKIGNFELTDDARAEWAMRKVADWQLRVNEINMQAEEWKLRIEQHRIEQTRRLEARIAVFEIPLAQYGINHRLRTKEATTTLPSGKIKTTQSKTATVFIDSDREAQFVKWAQAHLPEEQLDVVVKFTPKTYVSELRKLKLRVVDAPDGEHVVEWSPDGEKDWTKVEGVYVEIPGKIKPTVTPDLHR